MTEHDKCQCGNDTFYIHRMFDGEEFMGMLMECTSCGYVSTEWGEK
jgi:hypothetical protein